MGAHRAAALEPERPARLQPQPHEVGDQGLAQLQLQGFDQPPLRDVQDQQHACNHREDAELHDEVAQVATRDRVVERLVPAIELDLRIRRERDDHDDPARQRGQRLADRGHSQGAEQSTPISGGRRRCSLPTRRAAAGHGSSRGWLPSSGPRPGLSSAFLSPVCHFDSSAPRGRWPASSMPSSSPLGFRFEVSDESHRHPHGPDDAGRKAGPADDDCRPAIRSPGR